MAVVYLVALAACISLHPAADPGSVRDGDFENVSCRDEGFGRYTLEFTRPQWVNVRLSDGTTLARFTPSPVRLTTPNWTKAGPREFIVEAPNGKVIKVRARNIFLEGARNLRDLGGYPAADGKSVVWGQLYRSDALDRITEADARVLGNLGLACIVDFRTDTEKAPGAVRSPSESVISLPIPNQGNGGNAAKVAELLRSNPTAAASEELMVSAYRSMPEEGAAAFRGFFDRLKSTRGPILVHCSAGKDRTGLAAAFLLTILGVPRDFVYEDYLRSNEFYTNSPIQKQQLNGLALMVGGNQSIAEEAMVPIFRTDKRYLDAAFSGIDRRPGGWTQFRREVLGVSDADQAGLRRRYLR